MSQFAYRAAATISCINQDKNNYAIYIIDKIDYQRWKSASLNA